MERHKSIIPYSWRPERYQTTSSVVPQCPSSPSCHHHTIYGSKCPTQRVACHDVFGLGVQAESVVEIEQLECSVEVTENSDCFPLDYHVLSFTGIAISNNFKYYVTQKSFVFEPAPTLEIQAILLGT